MNIGDAKFSVRTTNCLHNFQPLRDKLGIGAGWLSPASAKMIDDTDIAILAEFSSLQLLGSKGFGSVCLKEVVDTLAANGLTLPRVGKRPPKTRNRKGAPDREVPASDGLKPPPLEINGDTAYRPANPPLAIRPDVAVTIPVESDGELDDKEKWCERYMLDAPSVSTVTKRMRHRFPDMDRKSVDKYIHKVRRRWVTEGENERPTQRAATIKRLERKVEQLYKEGANTAAVQVEKLLIDVLGLKAADRVEHSGMIGVGVMLIPTQNPDTL